MCKHVILRSLQCLRFGRTHDEMSQLRLLQYYVNMIILDCLRKAQHAEESSQQPSITIVFFEWEWKNMGKDKGMYTFNECIHVYHKPSSEVEPVWGDLTFEWQITAHRSLVAFEMVQTYDSFCNMLISPCSLISQIELFF